MYGIFSGLYFSAIYIFLCMFFASCFSGKRDRKISVIFAYCAIWMLLVTILSVINSDYLYIRMVFIPLCSIVFLWILYDLSILQALLIGLSFYGIGCVIDYLVYIVYNYLIGGYDIYSAENSVASMVLGTISQIIIFVIIMIIASIRGNYFSELLNKKDWFRLSIFPIFSIIVSFSLVTNFSQNNSDKQNFTLMLISIGLLFLNFFVLIVMREIMTREAQIREAQLMYERAAHTAQRYFDKAENYEEQRIREHEFKNHLSVIHNLICNSDYERAKSYTEQLSEQDESSIDVIDMNHPVINSVVNIKYREALAKGIFMSFEVCDISDVSISDKDITIIVSNLLSNAIEACEKDCGENGFIKFKLSKENHHLYIAVINSFLDKPVVRNGAYISTKKDKLIHGFGIRNIMDAIKRNNGDYVIDTSNNEFSFVICIPI